jgi:hypothetical protein
VAAHPVIEFPPFAAVIFREQVMILFGAVNRNQKEVQEMVEKMSEFLKEQTGEGLQNQITVFNGLYLSAVLEGKVCRLSEIEGINIAWLTVTGRTRILSTKEIFEWLG